MAITTIRNGNVAATHAVTASFTDAVTSIPGAANVDGLLRNMSPNDLVVVKGGASAPSSASSGEVLPAFDAVYCSSDHIWVRGAQGGTVGFEVLS